MFIQCMKKEIDYLEDFMFPDIPWQNYPVYSVSEKGNIYNLKNIIYPSPKSAKKFTRKKQLNNRSLQAKIFDAFINIGYFNPLSDYIAREFPIIIQNHLRLDGLENGYILLDYFFANLKDPESNYWGLDVELDSELHSPEKDKIRDEYLEKIGIRVFRINHLEQPGTQKKEFHDLTAIIRSMTPTLIPRIFSFSDNIRLKKGI